MAFDLGFGRPVPPEIPLVVNHGWEKPAHAGVDIGLSVGTPLLAVADGTVVRSASTNSSDAGIHVDLLTTSGALARYLHMSQLAIKTGDFVAKGQLIGLSGNTGLTTGPHLHFETRVPDEMLPKILEATGNGDHQVNLPKSMYLNAVPTEPWLPVDDYLPGVVANAQRQGIPLYNQISHPKISSGSLAAIFWGGLLTLGGVWAYKRWYR